MASAAFLLSQGRAYYWLVGNDPAGREVWRLRHCLVDAFIRDYANKGIFTGF